MVFFTSSKPQAIGPEPVPFDPQLRTGLQLKPLIVGALSIHLVVYLSYLIGLSDGLERRADVRECRAGRQPVGCRAADGHSATDAQPPDPRTRAGIESATAGTLCSRHPADGRRNAPV